MGQMHQFVGGYNTRKRENEKRQMAFEAKVSARKELKARQDEIFDLVARTFWQVEKKNKRSRDTMIKAYATAEAMANLGGEDYAETVKALRFAFTGPAAYADACAACLIGVND